MKPIVVGFAGSIASGKSTLSIEVASSLEWQRVSFEDYVRTVAQSQGLGDSREVLQAVGASLAAIAALVVIAQPAGGISPS